MNHEDISFVLAMATVNGSPPFPVVVLDNNAAISIAALAPLSARLGSGLTGTGSIYDLLQNWQHNLPVLKATINALDDASLGKYTRSAFAALEFFDLLAPIPTPRQIFSSEGMPISRPVSVLAGPTAKVPVPPGANHLTAGTSLVVVLGAPTYLASAQEAESSIAGVMAASRYRDNFGRALSPALLPIGPFFVPLEYCDTSLDGRISFNGETSVNSSEILSAAFDAVHQVSASCHLFPGDLIELPMGPQGTALLHNGDIVETAISGLGQQTTNVIVESKYADPGNGDTSLRG